MNLKWIGAIFVIGGCGGMGFVMAFLYKRELSYLKQLAAVLEFMSCELEYRRTPLPQLCAMVSSRLSGQLRSCFSRLSDALESQIAPDVSCCMSVALQQTGDIPSRLSYLLQQLGSTMGQFDLCGQLKGLESVRKECERELAELDNNRIQRTRSYQTLGLCAGAALAILFL